MSEISMPNSEDYRKYLDERFCGLNTLMNANFITIHDKFDDITHTLDKIEDHTSKTNGRVNSLEDFKIYVDGVIERRGEKLEEHMDRIERIENRLEKLENNLTDVQFFVRHPKLFIAILVVSVTLTLATFLTNNPLKVFDKTPLPNTEIPIGK